MDAAVYLGDEVSAAGWRLAGATVRTPLPGEEAAQLGWAREHAVLVLLSAEVAAAIAEPALRRALGGPRPLVLVVPDLQGRSPMPDMAARLRRQLGLDP